MKRRCVRRSAVLGAATLLPLCLGTAAIAPASAGAPSPARSRAVAAQSVATLGDVDQTSHTDLWAVGTRYPNAHPAIWHSDGTTWKRVPIAAPVRQRSGFLASVSARTASDAWAVGYYWNPRFRGVVFHWDGTRWTQAASPHPGHSPQLLSVSADSAKDAWAVGTYSGETVLEPLVMHFDGSSWTQVDVPVLGGDGDTYVYAVTAVSPTLAWLVGRYVGRAFIERWDGTSWKLVRSPNPPGFDTLWAVTALSATDAWAVGGYDPPGSPGFRPLMEHWDGSSWTKVGTARVGTGILLQDVSAASSTQAWAVGCYRKEVGWGTLTMRWDGTSWSRVASPNLPGSGMNCLHGVSVRTTKDATAVGTYSEGDWLFLPIFMHWNGARWVLQ